MSLVEKDCLGLLSLSLGDIVPLSGGHQFYPRDISVVHEGQLGLGLVWSDPQGLGLDIVVPKGSLEWP